MTGGERVVVAERFEGPPGCANGGYVCGLLAAHMAPGPLRVTLRRPVPLERPLSLAAIGRERLALVQAEAPYAVLVADDGGSAGGAGPRRGAGRGDRGREHRRSGEIPQVGARGRPLGRSRTLSCCARIRSRAASAAARSATRPRPSRCTSARLAEDLWATTWTPHEALPHEPGGGSRRRSPGRRSTARAASRPFPPARRRTCSARLEGWVHGTLSVGEELIVARLAARSRGP